MRKMKGGRLISLLLALVMVLGLFSVSVYAEDAPADEVEPAAVSDVVNDGDSEESETLPAQTAETAQADPDEEQEEGSDSELTAEVSDYDVFLSALTELEQYAESYAREHDGEDPIALVINFIRTGVEKYNSGTWNTFCGEEKKAFTSYVTELDDANGTNASCLRSLGEFRLPNGNVVEFAHMFGCMDMAYHTGNQATADLGSWAGDICDLVQLSQNYGVTGTVDEMADQIRTDNEHLFLYDNPHAHSFGQKDVYGDLDAFYILSSLNGSKTISDIMKSYYTTQLNDCFRAAFFLENRLGGANSKADIRSAVFEIYSGNEGIRTLEGTYLENGVNPDIRKACCYAFADYLYLTAQDRLDNPYYTVFSSEKSNIAPGVTQEIKMAVSADNKQMVYYLATADVARSDVSVYANYGDNDGSAWKMARVSDQVAAAQAKHSDPADEEHYIPNYNAVASVNADFYNMSDGEVSGTLIMEGIEYHGITSSNFFGILKDGTPIIGGKAEYNAYHDQLQEAVGASIWLVKNGEIAVTATSNYYNNRASRTAVGITYDGKVVLMVLDGRQEPWSCGGSSIEIAQIMLDAGCVSAVNLDGGGSTTYVAKPEGAETPMVINRPSDGYERSVSSSLLVVSTAKPSNVFDHAVVSADYDYLTVGTELEIDARGVTATGGAIDLPESAVLQVSDESIGALNGNVFTASALGDVQVQVVSAEGEVLGTKLLHVVQPTELKFTRDSLNVVYGEPETMPLEATYDGKLVKVNPNDVAFGYMKLSLQSIGNVEGGDVNTTRTELVFDYPEAGAMSGFDFTGNEAGGVRTLTVGAVLATKLNEFQDTVSSEFMAAYQKAIADGFTNQQAQLIAEEVAVNKALATAASIKLYLYSADEANFDFSQETGSDGLLHWKREVSNSRYQREINMYYRLDPAESMTTNYTFAVDMSKMPIPEKLTGLLYMLPGGDQEGRTAWSFLLQLAERISPLTNVTVDIHIPDGFDVDYSDLKIVNEYFDLTSIKYQDNTLKLTANFKLQTEPINPTTANPLCVVSGLKLTPNDEAAWDAIEPDQLNVEVSGELNYDIYAHFHALKSLASQEEYQVNYGLFPYDNSANLAQDYGAHFSSASDTPITFHDQYRLNRESKDGWAYAQGSWSFYQNGVKLTGVQNLPSYQDGEEGTFWYDLGENGACKGKMTGMFESDGALYYAGLGELKTGWREIDNATSEGDFYYFSPENGQAVDGEQTIKGLTYTFENHILVKGAWVDTSTGRRYYWAGSPIARKWREIDGKRYYFGYHGDAMVGFCQVERANGNQGADYYLFDDTGALIIRPGMYRLTSDLPFIYKDFKVGDIVYFDDTGKAIFAGLVEDGENLYYINANLKATRNGKYWVTKTNGLIKSGLQRTFDADGKMIIREGVIRLDSGYLVYYVRDDMQVDLGLVKLPDGRMIYVNPDSTLHSKGKRSVTKTNGLLPAGKYDFDSEGYLQLNGWLTDDRGTTYYQNTIRHEEGWDVIDGNGYYFDADGYRISGVQRLPYPDAALLPGYVPNAEDLQIAAYPDAETARFIFDDSGVFQKDLCKPYDDHGTARWIQNGMVLWSAGLVKNGFDYYYYEPDGMIADREASITRTNGLLPAGSYEFDADGILQILNGLYLEDSGDLYYYVNGVKTAAGLVRDAEGNYYYIDSDCKAVRNTTCYVSNTNGLLLAGNYTFDADGKLVHKNGVVEEEGELYYYENSVRVAKGLAEYNGDCYFFPSTLKAVKNEWCNVPTDKTNDLANAGWYMFDADGRMQQSGLREENGMLYYYENGEKSYAGLIEVDGAYYYIRSDCSAVMDQNYYVTRNNGLMPSKTYLFGPDGKMIIKNGIFREKLDNGKEYLFYYVDNVRQMNTGLTQLEDGSYIYVRSGADLAIGDYYVYNNNNLLPRGTYHFGDDGIMVVN